MATIDLLEAAGVLHPIGVRVKPPGRIARRLYGTERCRDWIADVFRTNPPSPTGLEETPKLQLYSRIKQYQSGQPLLFDREFHPLIPGERYIWEIKTADTRIFGFFYKKDVFVAVIADFADRVKQYRLYSGYRDEADSFRYYNSIPYVKENGEHHVLS